MECLGLCDRDVPWQEFFDLVDRMVGDLFEHVMKIEFGVEPVELGRSEQRVDGCGAFSACVRSREEIVFPS